MSRWRFEKGPAVQDDQMGRGEMVRRLDEAAGVAAEALAIGKPLTPEEQHAIAVSLAKLLPLVADSLQAQLDIEAAAALTEGAGDAVRTAASSRDQDAARRDREAARRDLQAGVRDWLARLQEAGREQPGLEAEDARREAARDRMDAMFDRQSSASDRHSAARDGEESARATPRARPPTGRKDAGESDYGRDSSAQR